MSKPDTNQASEDELRDGFAIAFQHAGLYPYDDDTAAQLMGEIVAIADHYITNLKRQHERELVEAVEDCYCCKHGYGEACPKNSELLAKKDLLND